LFDRACKGTTDQGLVKQIAKNQALVAKNLRR